MAEMMTDLQIVTSLSEMTAISASARESGKKIGLVPTMGYLHDGHRALIEEASRGCDFVIVSIFVNPLQFGPGEDLDRYPRDLQRDMNVAARAGAALLFVPGPEEFTPLDLLFAIDPGPMKEVLCGQFRPGHFEGVCTIVLKLFNVTRPDVAFFGWKDAQQFIILQKMVKDLNVPVDLKAVETVREGDGLAMSSRNAYLSAEERACAPAISRVLSATREQLLKDPDASVTAVIDEAKEDLNSIHGMRVQYMELVSKNSLRPINAVDQGNTLLATAVFVGEARLIDNTRF
jgi:pantoate--beta-alanine ligase